MDYIKGVIELLGSSVWVFLILVVSAVYSLTKTRNLGIYTMYYTKVSVLLSIVVVIVSVIVHALQLIW